MPFFSFPIRIPIVSSLAYSLIPIPALSAVSEAFSDTGTNIWTTLMKWTDNGMWTIKDKMGDQAEQAQVQHSQTEVIQVHSGEGPQQW